MHSDNFKEWTGQSFFHTYLQSYSSIIFPVIDMRLSEKYY